MPNVIINTKQCENIGKIIKKLKLRRSFFEREFIVYPADTETKLKMYIFPIAICHQTHTLINKKKNLKGWDCLEDAYLRIAKDGSDLLDINYLAEAPLDELIKKMKPYFSEDNTPENCTLDKIEERAEFLKEIAQTTKQNYGGRIENIIKKSDGYIVNNGNGLYELLEKFPAYSDPMKKKSTYLIKVLTEAGLFTVKDEQNFLPVMDYHMQRVLLRMGCVEINDENLKKQLFNKEKLNSDEEIRSACIQAAKLIANFSGYPIINMNDFFWPLGRSCCKEKLLCVNGECNKKPCTFELAVELDDHKKCQFADVCKASIDPEYQKFWQPIIETHYY